MNPMPTIVLFLALSMMMQIVAIQSPTEGIATYRNSALHFSFEYPANLKVNETVGQAGVQKAKQKAGGETAKALQCLTTPLVAVENPGKQNFGFVIATQSDLGCENQSIDGMNADALSHLTQTALATAMKMLGTPTIGTPITYKLAGRLASVVEAKIGADTSPSKADIFGEAACVVIRQDVVCWSAMSADRARLHQILGGDILFAKTTLIPAELLAR
jgi:hypothetical protein